MEKNIGINKPSNNLYREIGRRGGKEKKRKKMLEDKKDNFYKDESQF